MDKFSLYTKGLESPADTHTAIVPSNTTDLPNTPRCLHCIVEGTVVVRDKFGTDITYPMTVGQTLVFRGVRIMATGTTGTVVGWE